MGDDAARTHTPRTRATRAPRNDATMREIESRNAEFATWPAVYVAVRRVARFSFETGRVLGLRAPAAASAV